MTINYKALLNAVENIARDAGAAIYSIYGSEFLVVDKEDHSPLTDADSAAHVIITDALSRLAPDIPILSEEDVSSFSGPNEKGQYWLVDPLDGTKEFIRRNGEFTVNIALIEHGKPSLGVVFAPVLNISYVAAQGVGAFKRSGNLERHQIKAQAHIKDRPWRVVSSRSHSADSLSHFLKQLGGFELLSMGSSLKFCLVAEGRADIYPRFGLTSLWDTAAAQCVLEKAGGHVTQLNGRSLSYADPSTILNPFFIAFAGHDTELIRTSSLFAERH
jgi:3'(2'), 5'-bisphosphate nucleotidase